MQICQAIIRLGSVLTPRLNLLNYILHFDVVILG